MLRKVTRSPRISTKGNHLHDHDEKKGVRHRRKSIIKAVTTLLKLIVLYRLFLYFRPSPILLTAIGYDEVNYQLKSIKNVINLKSIDPILSTVPLGFTLDIPEDLGTVEIYLDNQLVSSIDDTASLSTQDGHSFNFGTCDISDHGDNKLKHAFSLGEEELGNLKSILLKPGNHIIEIGQRKGKKLIMYAQMALRVNSPPQLILGESTFWSSPYEDAYNLALKEIGSNIACNHFVAGAGWAQLWTRDTSFAAELGGALLHPQVVKQSLMTSVEDYNGGEVWLQDKCGHFGGWPNLSDAIVGARGAWSYYLVTGDKEFLSWAYNVTLNSITRAEEEVYDQESGLFRGCSSFMESNSGYPEKYMYDGELALSTNMLYYSGYKLAFKMAIHLGADPRFASGVDSKPIVKMGKKAVDLKKAIQKRLWSSSKRNYAYFEDENGMLVDNNEGLGIALALLDFNDDFERNKKLIESTHTTKYGIPCLWPQFNYSDGFEEHRISRHYHNGRLWPFVQGYWAKGMAQNREVDLFSESLKGLTTLSQQGNTFAEFYQLNGTFPDERRGQLWSATGYLSMIYHGVFGIRLELDELRFSPMKTKDLFPAQTIHLNGLRYRKMVLNIHLHGHGTVIESFALNHKKQSITILKPHLSGDFEVDITLS